MTNATKKQTQSGNGYKPGIAANDSMLKDFFEDELKDIYWAEKNIVKALPRMQKAATSEKLQQAFEEHLQQTQTHVERLEQVFEILGKKHRQKNVMQWPVYLKRVMALLVKRKKVLQQGM